MLEQNTISERMPFDRKKFYSQFCQTTYVPIFSQPWWMDAMCGPQNWDVWLCEEGGEIVAAMPYFHTVRKQRRYITKAKLTQNNGIVFKHPNSNKPATLQAFEERIINKACDFIGSMELGVYEQQYHYSFTNWLPFYWRGYTAIPRYTFVLDTSEPEEVLWEAVSAKTRSIIRKGGRNCTFDYSLDSDTFYAEHEKIFLKQGLQCPFSYEEWGRLYETCSLQGCCQIICARDNLTQEVASVIFLVWDDESAYHLLGGSVPAHQRLDTYQALIWEAIKFIQRKNLKYDFEGSVIKRIAKSMREFGGTPQCYFRIRRVFNADILREECESAIHSLATL